ncbi:MAG: serine--tRNA ligase [Candidatus Melainabacteria bacterium]
MLDIKRIRENADAVNALLKRRNGDLSVDAVLALDARRRELLQEEEVLRSQRNQLTQSIAQAKREGQDTSAIQVETKALGERIKAIESEKDQLAEQQDHILLTMPNTPLADVPQGASEEDNVLIRTWGDEYKTRYCADALNHYDIGPAMGILDFERGVKVAQSRFTVMRGDGARLERALISFMLDTHAGAGYEEVLPPFLVNAQTMTGTGQLPKFEEDMFRCRDDALYLIPTAEVPVTNLYRDELLDESQLPMKFCAYTPCFRREAGAAGRDTRGLIRQHQFDKVELVQLVRPEEGLAAHAQLVADAERILQRLELPYRVVELCTADLGFGAAKCYDLEVWMPAQGVYREISSCSLFTDFQARRANLRYRSTETGKPAFLYTLNGSGLAVGRTLAAILENYQISHQEVTVPEVLRSYLRGNGDTLQTTIGISCHDTERTARSTA